MSIDGARASLTIQEMWLWPQKTAGKYWRGLLGTFFRPFPLGPPFESLSVFWVHERSQLQTLGCRFLILLAFRQLTPTQIVKWLIKDRVYILCKITTISEKNKRQTECASCHARLRCCWNVFCFFFLSEEMTTSKDCDWEWKEKCRAVIKIHIYAAQFFVWGSSGCWLVGFIWSVLRKAMSEPLGLVIPG